MAYNIGSWMDDQGRHLRGLGAVVPLKEKEKRKNERKKGKERKKEGNYE